MKLMKVKPIQLLVAICCLISNLILCVSSVCVSGATVASTPGPSSKLVVEEDGYRFYKSEVKGKNLKLVCQQIGSEKQTTVTTDKMEEFWVDGAYVYYVKPNWKTSKHSIYRVRRDGKKKQCIVTAYQLKMIGVQGNYVYYCYYKAYAHVIVARVKVNGGSQKILTTTNTNYYNFLPVLTNNHIYYTNNKRTIIYSLTIGGKKLEELVKGTEVENLTASEDGLYYMCNKNKSYSIMKLGFDGELTTLDCFDWERIKEHDESKGFKTVGDNGYFEMQMEQVTADYVYCSVLSSACAVYRCATDGSGSELYVDELEYRGGGEFSIGIWDFAQEDDAKVVAFGSDEQPITYYYEDASGKHMLDDILTTLVVMGDDAYYRKYGDGGVSYGYCKISDLFIK